MADQKKNRPTPKQRALKATTVDAAVTQVFDGQVRMWTSLRNWPQVESWFLWYAQYLERVGASS